MDAWDEPDRAAAGRSADGLRRIVRYQRWLIAVVLAQLALWGGFAALTVVGTVRDLNADFPLALTVILGAAGGVFVFLLSWDLRGPFAAVVFGLATVVPCIGLIVLALVNGYATTELKKHGLKVGAFGATTAAIDERPQVYDDGDDAGW